mgnify:CR=1 FL=1
MRWKTPQGIQHGDRRTVWYFALFPTKLDDGYTVWLERYWAEEVWQVCEYDGYFAFWKTIKTSINRPNETTE